MIHASDRVVRMNALDGEHVVRTRGHAWSLCLALCVIDDRSPRGAWPGTRWRSHSDSVLSVRGATAQEPRRGRRRDTDDHDGPCKRRGNRVLHRPRIDASRRVRIREQLTHRRGHCTDGVPVGERLEPLKRCASAYAKPLPSKHPTRGIRGSQR